MELELRSHGQSCMSVTVSRTVSLQVPLYLVRSELLKDGDDGDGVPDSVYRKSKRDEWLQLMCCALSELPSSQFTRGRGIVLRADEREGD